MLQLFPDVAEHYHRRFRHVLVDEYQDTNHAQYVLVNELVGDGADGVPPAQLCVVGDADQSIYAFRGATIRNIEEFERDYPNATTVLLEQNYRSTQTILDGGQRGHHAQHRAAREAAVDRRRRRRPDRRLRRRQRARRGLVRRRRDRPARPTRTASRPRDVAVFYRTNAQSRSLEEVFIRVGLPYKVVGGVRFYERKEIRDAVAYLRALANPDDDISLRRILNTPRRGIGDRAEALRRGRSPSASGSPSARRSPAPTRRR